MFDWHKLSEKEITKKVMDHYIRLKGLREVHEPIMRIDNKLFIPRRAELLRDRRKGDDYAVSIFDANPAQASRKFSIGYVGHVVEKGAGDQWWLNFEMPDQELMKVDEIKKYLQDYATQIRYGYDRSTFYREFPPFMRDGSVTTGIMTAESDNIKDKVVFRKRDPWDHWFGIDQYGDIDCDFFRLFMTSKTLVEKFESGKLPNRVNKNMNLPGGDPFATHEVVLAVYKNGSIRFGSKSPDDLPYISFYVMPSDKPGQTYTLLGRQGRDHKPLNIRIGERTDSGIPISMASDALTSAIYGNALSKHTLKASHLGVEPPVIVSGTLQAQILDHKLNPNSKTYVKDAEERLEYVNTKLNYQVAVDAVLRNDAVVDDIFYITFLEMLTRRESSVKTLGEIYEMLEEKLGLMGPVVEATEDDALEPATEIIAKHEEHRLPKMPQQLLDYIETEGQFDSGGGKRITLKNKYMGRLHRLKRSLPQAKSAIEQIAVMKEYKDIFPDALVIIDERRTLERILDGRGMPRDEFKTHAMLAQIDAEIQRRKDFEQQMEFAERSAKIIPSVTKDAVDPASPAALVAQNV